MDSAAQKQENNKRYSPHMVSTKEGAPKRYRQTKDMDFVLRALLCFGYAPDMIRTDNGGELTPTQRQSAFFLWRFFATAFTLSARRYVRKHLGITVRRNAATEMTGRDSIPI